MYVSTQKLPQILLYMFIIGCESFKSFKSIWKSFGFSNFYDPEISPSAENRMILTAPYSEVSSPMTNLFLSELLQYMGNMFKKVWMEMILGLDFIVILEKASLE